MLTLSGFPLILYFFGVRTHFLDTSDPLILARHILLVGIIPEMLEMGT